MATAVSQSQSNAINIHVFRNGDSHYKGRKFVVNQRQTRNFDAFLSMVTTGVKPPYGAVRKLYTPTHGHKVDDLSRLENNKYYVAAGMERFRRVQYFSIGRPDGAPRQTSILQRSIKPVAHSRIQASAKISKPADGPKTIHVYRNGDTLYPSVRLLLTKRMLSNWDVVLQVITERVNLINGAVRKLWHMDGSRVIELSEIENDTSYVASGNDKFKKVAYGINGPLEPSSPRIKRPAPPKQKPIISRKPTKITQQKVTPPKKVPKKPPQPKPEKKKKKEKTAEQKEAETVIRSKPTMVKRSREKDESDVLDFGENDKSVFKAKEGRKETKGAAEIQDSQETAIDLPIDQIAAEEVEEEVAPSQDVDPEEDTYRKEDTIPREKTFENTLANSFSEPKKDVVDDYPDNSFSEFKENTAQDLFEETPADNNIGTVENGDQKREIEPATRSGYEVVEEETEKNADKDRTTPTEEQLTAFLTDQT